MQVLLQGNDAIVIHTDGGKSYNTRCSFANSVKYLGLAVFSDIMCNLKVSKCSTSLGMNNSLWDSLTIEVAHLIQKLDIL